MQGFYRGYHREGVLFVTTPLDYSTAMRYSTSGQYIQSTVQHFTLCKVQGTMYRTVGDTQTCSVSVNERRQTAWGT